MRCHTKPRKGRKQPRLRKKKLSRAVQLAVLSMSVLPGIALADVKISGVVSDATSVPNTGTINADDDAFKLIFTSDISGGITNSGTITAVEDCFYMDPYTISGGVNNSQWAHQWHYDLR